MDQQTDTLVQTAAAEFYFTEVCSVFVFHKLGEGN